MPVRHMHVRAQRDDGGRIDHVMALVIVPFGVLEIEHVGHPMLRMQAAGIGVDVRIVDQALEIAFEMADI